MANPNKVNARIACSNRAHFCVFLLTLGRFLLFKIPVKYNRIFEVNHEDSQCGQPSGWVRKKHVLYQWLS
jgi:hypothetical protein